MIELKVVVRYMWSCVRLFCLVCIEDVLEMFIFLLLLLILVFVGVVIVLVC